MTVYADVYFVLNFVFDLLICLICIKVLHIKTKFIKVLAASTIGAASAVAEIMADSIFISVIFTFVIPFAMIFTFSGLKSFSFYIKAYVLIFGTSFVMGGAILWLSRNALFAGTKKLTFLVLFCALFFCFYYFDIFSAESGIRSVEIELECGRKKEKYKLLCDSGCLVREPFSGLPVILLSPNAFDKVFEPRFMFDKAFCVRYKKRSVPIKTAAGSTVVFSFCPDRITYFSKDKKIECNAMVARAENDSFAGFDGIFPENLYKS